VITTLFYGFEPDFVAAIAVAGGVLVAVAALASVLPARRNSRINPVVALQQE
jgi:ABC-type lipoprotein release transport system permease subunit